MYVAGAPATRTLTKKEIGRRGWCDIDQPSDQASEDTDSDHELRLTEGNLLYVGYEDNFLNSLPRKNISRKRTCDGQFTGKDTTRSLYMHLQNKWPTNGVMCSCRCIFFSAAGVQSHMKRLSKNRKCRLFIVREIYDVEY